MLKLFINKILIIISAILVYTLAFILLGGINNYYKGNLLISIISASIYLIIVIILTIKLNSIINNLKPIDFLGRNHLKGLLYGIIIGFICFLLPAIILFQLEYSFEPIEVLLDSTIGFIIVAISEELVFRAFLFMSILKLTRKPMLSVILSSIIFTLIHYNSIEILPHILWIFGASILMNYTYMVTGSIVSAITLHFVINLLSSFIILPPENIPVFFIVQSSCMILLGALLALYTTNKKGSVSSLTILNQAKTE